MIPPRMLTPEEEKYLRDNYATTLNRDIVKHLKTSPRTLARWARAMGLIKDMNAIEAQRRILISKCVRHAIAIHSFKYHPENNLKGRFKPGYNAREFFGEEKFNEMHRKTVESRKRTYAEERARATFGLPQKTKLRVKKQPRKKIEDRYYLKRHGYIIDNAENIAYYTEDTVRAYKLEAGPKRYFSFKPYPYAEHQREPQDIQIPDGPDPGVDAIREDDNAS